MENNFHLNKINRIKNNNYQIQINYLLCDDRLLDEPLSEQSVEQCARVSQYFSLSNIHIRTLQIQPCPSQHTEHQNSNQDKADINLETLLFGNKTNL